MNKIDVVGMKKKHGDFHISEETVAELIGNVNDLIDAVKELQERKGLDDSLLVLAKSMAEEMRKCEDRASPQKIKTPYDNMGIPALIDYKDEYLEENILEGRPDDAAITEFINWLIDRKDRAQRNTAVKPDAGEGAVSRQQGLEQKKWFFNIHAVDFHDTAAIEKFFNHLFGGAA